MKKPSPYQKIAISNFPGITIFGKNRFSVQVKINKNWISLKSMIFAKIMIFKKCLKFKNQDF